MPQPFKSGLWLTSNKAQADQGVPFSAHLRSPASFLDGTEMQHILRAGKFDLLVWLPDIAQERMAFTPATTEVLP